MYTYTYRFFCLYWFLKSRVFVTVCLRDGLFIWTSTHWTSYCMLSASGTGILKWPASAKKMCGLFLLQACGQRNEQGWWKTPLCTFVQRWYFGSASQCSFHLVHLYLHPQHVCRKLIQLTWQHWTQQLIGILIPLSAWRLWIWHTRGPQTVVKHEHQ